MQRPQRGRQVLRPPLTIEVQQVAGRAPFPGVHDEERLRFHTSGDKELGRQAGLYDRGQPVLAVEKSTRLFSLIHFWAFPGPDLRRSLRSPVSTGAF
jgi:hypothetical protein